MAKYRNTRRKVDYGCQPSIALLDVTAIGDVMPAGLSLRRPHTRDVSDWRRTKASAPVQIEKRPAPTSLKNFFLTKRWA